MKLISRLILIFVSMFFPEMLFRSSRPKVFCKKCIFRNFAKFTGKQNTSGGCLFFWNVHKYYSHFFIFLLPIILFFFLSFWSFLKVSTACKVFKYGVFSGPYFPGFGLNAGKYGPEKTPHLDTFHAVIVLRIEIFLKLLK